MKYPVGPGIASDHRHEQTLNTNSMTGGLSNNLVDLVQSMGNPVYAERPVGSSVIPMNQPETSY